MFVNGGRLPFRLENATGDRNSPVVAWDAGQLGWLFAITVLFSLGALAYLRFDGNRIFRFLRLTERTTGNSIWNDILEHEAIDDQPVQVELADGRSVLGILLYYSDTSDEASIYLKDAAWVEEDGNTVAIHGPGILLTKASGIQSVSLLNPPE